jgi:serine/threonine-protein kinase
MAGPAAAASATVIAAPLPVPPKPVETVIPATTVPLEAAQPVAAASVPSATPPATAGRRAPSHARSRIAASAPPPVQVDRPFASTPMPASPTVPARESRDEQRQASIPPPHPVRASQVDSCRDRNFVMREFCLAEQCDKPGARNHPLCVKRREDAKLREESKVRN